VVERGAHPPRGGDRGCGRVARESAACADDRAAERPSVA
jgi:hypothetical protein